MLRDKAIALSQTLNAVVAALEKYQRSEYITELAAYLSPIVARYDEAVYVSRSREQAAAAIDASSECMDSVNAAATRGETDIFGESVLERYWVLHTIFRESRYREQSL